MGAFIAMPPNPSASVFHGIGFGGVGFGCASGASGRPGYFPAFVDEYRPNVDNCCIYADNLVILLYRLMIVSPFKNYRL